MMISVARAVKDFNVYLAGKHASASKNGGEYKVNFAELAAEIDNFRITYYRSNAPHELPEVWEIEAAVRAAWGMKASATRKKKSARLAREQAAQVEKERQYVLPF